MLIEVLICFIIVIVTKYFSNEETQPYINVLPANLTRYVFYCFLNGSLDYAM